MKPTNEDNFLIEVTPEQLDELRSLYQYEAAEGYVEMHYSPYWNWEAHKARQKARTAQPNNRKGK